MNRHRMHHPLNLSAVLLLCPCLAGSAEPPAEVATNRRATVMGIPGCVAFWDFVKREPGGQRRFTAHVPPGATNDFPLDAGNCVRDYWGEGREATYADFPLLGRGPFGNAIRIVKETDPNFRPFLFVPHAWLHDSPLDNKHLITVQSDTHRTRDLDATHLMPRAVDNALGAGLPRFAGSDLRGGLITNSLDFYGMWKLFDALTDAAFANSSGRPPFAPTRPRRR